MDPNRIRPIALEYMFLPTSRRSYTDAPIRCRKNRRGSAARRTASRAGDYHPRKAQHDSMPRGVVPEVALLKVHPRILAANRTAVKRLEVRRVIRGLAPFPNTFG
jgi:hypothetical protein